MKKKVKRFTEDLENNPEELSQYLNLALEGANLGIWDWYLEDNSVKFDRRWAEMLGLDYDTLKMELNTWESRVHPDDLEKAYADIKAYMDGKTDFYENIHRMKHADGHWVYILDRGRFSGWDKSGKPTRFTGTHFDITASERNRQKLALFFERTPFGYAFCDMNGNLLEINARYAEITGYNLEELKGLSYWDLTPKKYEADESKQLKSIEETGRYGPYRKEYIRKDGTSIPVELNGFILEDYDGVKGIWSTVEDISERKHLESQLIHSSKLASIGILAAGVGHEINNPLAIIKALSDKLEFQNSDNPEVQQITGRINNAIERISKIVEGLRTFSKLDRQETSTFDIRKTIKESVHMLEEIYLKDGVEIQIDDDLSEPIFVTGNEGQLQQVFINLLSNAKDATSSNPQPKITLTLKVEDDSVSIKIADNGRGIPHENLDKIFDPFFTTKGLSEGTGIGLSIAYNIIRDHRGDISVDSLEGKGTAFQMCFPLAKFQGDEVMQPLEKPTLESKPVSTEQPGGTVMLVEDEEEFRELLSEHIEMIGYKVISFGNGQDALDEYMKSADQIDLIVSDVKMPKMDGPTLLKNVRAQTQLNQPEFVYISGGVTSDIEDLMKKQKHQASGILYKPFNYDEFHKLLHGLVGQAKLKQKKSA